MHLSILLRTHDRSNLHGERYTGTPKSEVTYRALYSLVRSINEALAAGVVKKESTTIAVLDDHSDHPDIIQKILSRAWCESRFEALPTRGNNDSLLRCFQLAAQAPDLVYVVEDDYLHEPSAIGEMVENFMLFSRNLGKPVAIHPFNDPDNYLPHGMVPSYIVQGTKRYWRTNDWSLGTFLIKSAMMRAHWDAFDRLARLYEKGTGVTELNTLTPLWRKEITLFLPIPSLALHVQDEQHKDPYINWRAWWDGAEYRHLV